IQEPSVAPRTNASISAGVSALPSRFLRMTSTARMEHPGAIEWQNAPDRVDIAVQVIYAVSDLLRGNRGRVHPVPAAPGTHDAAAAPAAGRVRLQDERPRGPAAGQTDQLQSPHSDRRSRRRPPR